MEDEKKNFSAMCFFPETGEFKMVEVAAGSPSQAAEIAKEDAAEDGLVPEVDSVFPCS